MTQEWEGSLTKEHIDKAISTLINQPPSKDYILLFGHHLEYGIKDAFENPVTGQLVIIANDKKRGSET